MKKRMFQMLAICAVFFGAIFGFQMFKVMMFKKYMKANGAPVVSVSEEPVQYTEWQPQLQVTGSLRAMKGVDITSEVPGLVKNIWFASGHRVKEDQVIVELNADADRQRLNALIAEAELAKISYERDKLQFEANAVSQSTLDAGFADLKSKQAQVAEQEAMIQKKQIQAPFEGYLGVSQINKGQYVNPGDKIVSLQSLDYVYVDFYIPQQELLSVTVGENVNVRSDAYPDKIFIGEISAIDPKIDPKTRNLHIQATICNTEQRLLPGMFVSVDMPIGKSEHQLTLPLTAVSYNPYGETVFVVSEAADEKGDPQLTATQVFVKVGEARGDQVAILSGIKEGDVVVVSGQFKLKSGDRVEINNKVLPSNNASPQPIDE